MQAFTDFILQVTAPEPDPQPRQLADACPSGRPRRSAPTGLRCSRVAPDCHELDTGANRRSPGPPGAIGTNGQCSFDLRSAGAEGPAPPEHVPEGRYVRHGPYSSSIRGTTTTRVIRSAASASSTTAASTALPLSSCPWLHRERGQPWRLPAGRRRANFYAVRWKRSCWRSTRTWRPSSVSR